MIEDEYKLVEELKYIVNNVRYEIESKGLKFQLNIGNYVPTAMYGDKNHINQIVINLLSNAIKFTKKGCITLGIDAVETDKYGKNGRRMVELCIYVEDTGIGIRKADRDKMFEAFCQFNSNSPYSNQGVGLGLTISKHFSNLMDGDILFESRYGKGSKFICKILQEVVDDTPLDRKYVADYVYNSDMRLSAPEAKVLLVDDSRVNLNVSSGLLLWFDIEAELAGGGMEAVVKAGKKDYDIIFMDHMMPDMDGARATKKIREMGGHNAEVPIIALTANTTDEARLLFRESGFTDFLAKPVEIDSFKAILERWLPFEKIARDVKSNATKRAELDNNIIDKVEFEKHGIYVNKGLVYFVGKISAYVDTLKIVYKEGRENVEKLKEYFSEQDWYNYGILAHSVKSVMASIGATKLSEKAKNHEFAVKEDNIDYILKKGEKFIADYSAIINFIGANIDMNESNEEVELGRGDTKALNSAYIKKIINEAYCRY